ncbi:type III pantothenate kinase, partial [Frankia casuarinae]
MLLAIDVGNTNTVVGVFEGEHLADSWRVRTDPQATADELVLLYRGLLGEYQVTGVSICSTVPAALRALRRMVVRAFHDIPVVIVEPGTR